MDNLILIAVVEARDFAETAPTLEGRLRAAMSVTRHHWIVTDEDSRFRAAIAAVILLSSEEDKSRILAEVEQLRILGAACNGIPVDLAAIEPLDNPIGLMKIWKEIK